MPPPGERGSPEPAPPAPRHRGPCQRGPATCRDLDWIPAFTSADTV